MIAAIAQSQATLGLIKTDKNDSTYSGLFLEKSFAKKMQSNGADVIELPKGKIRDTSGAVSGWNQAEVYFYPMENGTHVKLNSQAKEILESGNSELTLEAVPKK